MGPYNVLASALFVHCVCYNEITCQLILTIARSIRLHARADGHLTVMFSSMCVVHQLYYIHTCISESRKGYCSYCASYRAAITYKYHNIIIIVATVLAIVTGPKLMCKNILSLMRLL